MAAPLTREGLQNLVTNADYMVFMMVVNTNNCRSTSSRYIQRTLEAAAHGWQKLGGPGQYFGCRGVYIKAFPVGGSTEMQLKAEAQRSLNDAKMGVLQNLQQHAKPNRTALFHAILAHCLQYDDNHIALGQLPFFGLEENGDDDDEESVGDDEEAVHEEGNDVMMEEVGDEE
ncbi:hypothetical protein HK097_007340, partial [Rhizophlyctis rosea]